MINEFYKKETCRLCNSSNLTLVLPLHKSPLCDAYIANKKKQKFYDLNLYLCDECKFVQIDTVIDPETIYKDYIYVTSSSMGLVNHFNQYCTNVTEKINLEKDKLVVDIGSNEGSLLSAFQNSGYKVLGVEPSSKAANIANENGIETICDFFAEEKAIEIRKKYGTASLITVNNLYANIDDLHGFTKAVTELLDDNGVLVIESSYLLDMIDNMVFDFIYHEHLSYFSIEPLMKFFDKFDMHLVNVENISTKGGSLRYYWAKKVSTFSQDCSVDKLLKNELQYNISLDVFKKYNIRIENEKLQLLNFLEANKDKKIIGYGASATSTTLISHFGLDRYLDYLVDDNKDKVGTFSPGFHIPVYNLEKLNSDTGSSKVIIILAWRYKDNIMPNIQKANGDDIVIPLPNFQEN